MGVPKSLRFLKTTFMVMIFSISGAVFALRILRRPAPETNPASLEQMTTGLTAIRQSLQRSQEASALSIAVEERRDSIALLSLRATRQTVIIALIAVEVAWLLGPEGWDPWSVPVGLL